MAFFVTVLEVQAGSNQAKTKEIEWHVGGRKPDVLPSRILELQADGHELMKIQEIFGESVPMPKVRVAQWFGHIAATIFMNLPSH